MKISLHFVEIGLSSNRPVSLRRAKGTQISCTSGVIWLTVAGMREDIVLRPGEHFELPNNGLAVIEAIGPNPVTGIAGIAGLRLCIRRLANVAKRRLTIAFC